MTISRRKIIIASLYILAISGIFLFGIYVGYQRRPETDKVAGVLNKENSALTQADFEPFWKTWNLINEKSPSAENVSDQDKIYGAISGLTSSLNDPYTVFFPPGEAKSFEDSVNGEFEGVGLELGIKDKFIVVVAPLKDTPAYEAGLKPGDKILKIGDTLTADLSIEKAVKLIRGKGGTTVRLTILRDGNGAAKEITLTREVINIPALDTEIRSDGIFVIKLYQFSLNSAELFQKALQEFSNSKSSSLVLDLRGNPGGYLDAAVDMASWFLPTGKAVVVEDFGGKEKKKVYRSKGYDVFGKNLKMIILVDNGSASASEILAGALQEHGVAKLVGEQTYGKGSVQELIDITPDSSLKITIAKWLTPNGVSISEKGLMPDYVVPITKDDIAKMKDPQMEKAVDLLK